MHSSWHILKIGRVSYLREKIIAYFILEKEKSYNFHYSFASLKNFYLVINRKLHLGDVAHDISETQVFQHHPEQGCHLAK